MNSLHTLHHVIGVVLFLSDEICELATPRTSSSRFSSAKLVAAVLRAPIAAQAAFAPAFGVPGAAAALLPVCFRLDRHLGRPPRAHRQDGRIPAHQLHTRAPARTSLAPCTAAQSRGAQRVAPRDAADEAVACAAAGSVQ
eukprot:6205774-Pleurochrysis_carterae.AAC.3